MTFLLQYLIKFSISLALLYIFYRALLRPLTFYTWNRFYLLGYALLSFIIPFINISGWLQQDKAPVPFVQLVPVLADYRMMAETTPAVNQDSFFKAISLNQWLLFFFCIGAAIMLLRVVLQYRALRKIRKTAVLLRTEAQTVQLYHVSESVSPFSFGNAIYFNGSLHSAEELQKIIRHEFVHVRQKHSVDIMLGELLCIVNWFNPFAWLIRHAIRQNLEFIADNEVVSNGLDKKEYQYLLLKVVGIPQYSIANNFNLSGLKKRIIMMNKIKSTRLQLGKFLFLLPVLLVMLLAFRSVVTKNDLPKEFVFTGIIYDADSWKVMPGVSVYDSQSGLSATTDKHGFFKLAIPVRSNDLTIKYQFTLGSAGTTSSRTMGISTKTSPYLADLLFAGIHQNTSAAGSNPVSEDHHQVPMTSDKEFVANPDFAFVSDKFDLFRKQSDLQDEIDALVKDSKKPIWVIDGVPYAIGNGARAWFDKDPSNKIISFKVMADGKLVSMETANTTINRFTVHTVSAVPRASAMKQYGIDENLLVLVTNTTAATDTIPAQPSITVNQVNKKGYIISTADNNGECIILVKNKDQQIVKAMTLVEWNKNQQANEKQYGLIPPAPPALFKAVPDAPGAPALARVVPDNAAPEPLAKVVPDNAAPAAPYRLMYDAAPPSAMGLAENLPDDVEVIVTSTHTDKAKGTRTNTATVTLKNGKKENYNLDNPQEKAAFMQKYGRKGELRFEAVPDAPVPAAPVPSAPAKNPVPPEPVKLSSLPADIVFVVNGFVQPEGLGNITSNEIAKMEVVKNEAVTAIYGQKAKNGVVFITTKSHNFIEKSTAPVSAVTLRKTGEPVLPAIQPLKTGGTPVATSYPKFDYFIVDGSMKGNNSESFVDGVLSFGNKTAMPLVIVDGNEMPGIKDFKTPKAKYKIISLTAEQGVSKYGEKAKYGAMEINTITTTQPPTNTSFIWKENNGSDRSRADRNNDTIEGTMTANTIYIKAVHLIVTGGSVSTKGKKMIAEGALSFEQAQPKMPLVLYNGKEIISPAVFKAVKARYALQSMNETQGIAKYGSRAAHGALEINSL